MEVYLIGDPTEFSPNCNSADAAVCPTPPPADALVCHFHLDSAIVNRVQKARRELEGGDSKVSVPPELVTLRLNAAQAAAMSKHAGREVLVSPEKGKGATFFQPFDQSDVYCDQCFKKSHRIQIRSFAAASPTVLSVAIAIAMRLSLIRTVRRGSRHSCLLLNHALHWHRQSLRASTLGQPRCPLLLLRASTLVATGASTATARCQRTQQASVTAASTKSCSDCPLC